MKQVFGNGLSWLAAGVTQTKSLRNSFLQHNMWGSHIMDHSLSQWYAYHYNFVISLTNVNI